MKCTPTTDIMYQMNAPHAKGNVQNGTPRTVVNMKTTTDSWYVRCNCRFFELFEKYGGFKNGQLKLKRPKQLQEVLDIVRQLLSTGSFSCDPDLQDKKAKLQQMKLVLEM